MSHLQYLFAAYSVIFIALFAYLLFIGRKQSRLEASLEELEKTVRERLSASISSPPSESA